MEARIERLNTGACTVPTDVPESDGTLQWNSQTLVFVEVTADGVTGLGYTYAETGTAHLIAHKIQDMIVGQDAVALPAICHAMRTGLRNLGFPGLVTMAISAVDIAVWDLKAKLLDVPLYQLLGPARDSVPIYGSGGFTSYSVDELGRRLHDWVEQGIPCVKMKVGRHPPEDLPRVRAVREAIGPDAELYVDANGAYRRKQALKKARDCAEYGVTWFEEPVSSDDLRGLRLMRNRAPEGMEITAGEYGYDLFYFRRTIEAGAVDVLQADATRCGGITPFLKVAALCESEPIPLSTHGAPSVHAHICCAVQPLRHVEYFQDHVRMEERLFQGTLKPHEGALTPDPQRPGLGLELNRDEVEKHLVWQSD